ncbi:hypothetical protein [Rouxiella sp. Mn2063]|uniref:hypothetical protein n=1 Tax=Rouxiella sp. Mn2063 TaxID=3395262 RepID=UPI003BDC9677
MKEITSSQLFEISGAGFYHDEFSNIGGEVSNTIRDVVNHDFYSVPKDVGGLIGSGVDVAIHSIGGTVNFGIDTASKLISAIVPFK